MRDQVPGPALGELDRSVDATDVNHRAGECDAGEQELSVTQVRWGRLVSLCRSESVFLFGPLALLLGLGGRESGWWVRRCYSPTMAVRVRPVCNDAENKSRARTVKIVIVPSWKRIPASTGEASAEPDRNDFHGGSLTKE